MAKCWQIRGCPQEMLDTCPISVSKGLCLLNCAYARCFSSRSKIADSPAIIFGGPTQANIEAVKQACLTCEHYLTRGSRDGSSAEE